MTRAVSPVPSSGYGTIYGLRLRGTDQIRYVGLTRVSVEKRWREHRYAATYGRPQPVYSWIRKHGDEAIEPVVLEITNLDDVACREVFWISKLRLEGADLLNATDGGDGGVGRVVSAGTRALISAVHKGKVLSEETKRKIGLTGVGRIPWNKGLSNHLSDEARIRLSEGQRGRRASAETRAKMAEKHSGQNNHFFGKKHSEDTRNKMAAGQHRAHHTNKGISKPETCKFCKEEKDTN